jgi:hypothetical protein
MLKIKFDFDTRAATKMIDNLAKQVRYATARSLTATAHDVRTELGREMTSKLDRPTRWATGAWRVERATKDNLVATVAMRPGRYQPAEQLVQQFVGGGRAPKRFEVLLRQAGYIGAGEYIVPGNAASLDAFGNVRRSQLTAILRAIKAQPAKVNKRKSRSAVAGVFWSDGTRGLPKGAWARNGKTLSCYLLAVNATTYRPRVALLPVAERVVRAKFQKHFDAALAEALRTAK